MKKSILLLCLVTLLPGISDAKCYVCSHRSSSVRSEFKYLTGYRHGRPGYVIDHIRPLKRGGADAIWNLQWQTKAQARAKDRWE
jgi:hypothetical protein